ncbi:hypothetical protein LPJ79_002441 [Coemansia sp. RSA 1821]|nr:hypothetical protein LPJ79_002441 [Coemansia sp. RSA 1821]
MKLAQLKYSFLTIACFTALYLFGTSLEVNDPKNPPVSTINGDFTNKTLGFQRIYVIYQQDELSSKSNFEAIAALLDISATFIKQTTVPQATVLKQIKRYVASTPQIAELDTHARIYAQMVRDNIESALILDSNIDVELDLKERLASALSDVDLYDIIFVGHSYADPAEPQAKDTLTILAQTNQTTDPSQLMQRMWTKRKFSSQQPRVFRTTFPKGIFAYAINGRTARRLHRRFPLWLTRVNEDFEFILADVAMVGMNSTLGFQKILVLNMPHRHERRRNMNALARVHNLDLTYAKTVNRDEANVEAINNGYLINGTHLACYLSHLSLYRRIIAENIQTALIFEDDVDMEWDLKQRHKQIMDEVQLEYQNDWDMLYLGHCTSDINEPQQAGTDVELYEAEYPMCLHAYAVTLECAKRLLVLLEERLKTVGKDIDLILAVGTQFGAITVLGASPPYVVQVGRQELTSDISLLSEGDTAQRLFHSTLFHLGYRNIDPRTLPKYIQVP